MAADIEQLEAAAREAEAEFQTAQQRCDETNLLLETAIQDRADFLTLYADVWSRSFLQEWEASREPRAVSREPRGAK